MCTNLHYFGGNAVLFDQFRVCHAFLSVYCSLVVTCWERAGLLALLYVMFYCLFVTFPYGVLCKVWYVIVSFQDLKLLSYFFIFNRLHNSHKFPNLNIGSNMVSCEYLF